MAVTGWNQEDSGKWYYQNSDGTRATNTAVADSHVNEKGAANIGSDGYWDGTYAADKAKSNDSNLEVYDPTDDIKAMSAAQKQAALSSLKKAYQQNTSDLGAARSKIEPTYYKERNNVSTNAQIAARNFAEYMASRGTINSGTNAQAELSNNVALQGNLGNLARSEAADYTANDKQLADLKTAYQNDRVSTQAGIDANTMQSLINANQAYNAAKLAQANTDRLYNNDNYWKNVDATGQLANGAYTLSGQATKSQIDYQNAQTAYQKLVTAGYPAEQAADLALKYAQINAYKSSGSSGGSGGGSSKKSSSGGSAAQTWSNLIYGQKSNSDAMKVLLQKKSDILNDLMEDGMSGDSALKYWQNMQNDLSG